jgi:hypothetical protein
MPSELEQRARDRRSWPGVLTTEHAPAQLATAEERLASMWQLSLDAWAMQGRPLPGYTREDIPGRLIRPEPMLDDPKTR